MKQVVFYTIGHSNHSIDQFVALLERHGIETLVDIRRFPSSRRLPHFNRPNLAEALGEHDIEYRWLESLGGHRKEGLANSPDLGIRDEAIRNYADRMLSHEFREGAGQLLEIAENRKAAIMCAEKSFHDALSFQAIFRHPLTTNCSDATLTIVYFGMPYSSSTIGSSSGSPRPMVGPAFVLFQHL